MEELLRAWKAELFEWVHLHGPKVVVIFVQGAILIAILHLITRNLTRFSQRQELPAGVRAQQLRTLSGVINSVGRVIILFLVIMQVLREVNIDIGPLLASAGIAGLAVGFGAQTLVKDVINGFFILIENQYDLGDNVRVAGVTGTVEEMTLRRTMLRDADGTVHTIPNSEIKVVSNLTRDWTQVAVRVSVAFQESSERVINLLEKVANELRHDPKFSEMFVSEPTVPGIDRISGGEAEYLVLAKTRPGDQWPVGRELRRRIRDAFEKNQIRMPAPARMYVAETPGSPPTEVK